MNEQEIAPVLSDDEIAEIVRKWHESIGSMNALLRATEQSVLARVGALRDQAIEDAATRAWSSLMDICKRWAIAPAGAAGKWFGVCDAIRALKRTPAAAVADSMPGWSHWETRIKALMQDMGTPNSHSAYRALAQLANEMGQAHAASVARRHPPIPDRSQRSSHPGKPESWMTQRLNRSRLSIGTAQWGQAGKNFHFNVVPFAKELLSAAVSRAPRSAIESIGYTLKRVEGHGWIFHAPDASKWVAHDGTPCGEFFAAIAATKGNGNG